MTQNFPISLLSFEDHSRLSICHGVVELGVLLDFRHGEQLQIVIDMIKKCQISFQLISNN